MKEDISDTVIGISCGEWYSMADSFLDSDAEDE
jgi:hypothetical protein